MIKLNLESEVMSGSFGVTPEYYRKVSDRVAVLEGEGVHFDSIIDKLCKEMATTEREEIVVVYIAGCFHGKSALQRQMQERKLDVLKRLLKD